jgi:hypothetical protein
LLSFVSSGNDGCGLEAREHKRVWSQLSVASCGEKFPFSGLEAREHKRVWSQLSVASCGEKFPFSGQGAASGDAAVVGFVVPSPGLSGCGMSVIVTDPANWAGPSLATPTGCGPWRLLRTGAPWPPPALIRLSDYGICFARSGSSATSCERPVTAQADR